MKFENVNALYCDPNAFIKNKEKKIESAKKIVFQEPYETLPNFYINNNFKKKDCESVKEFKKDSHPHKKEGDCNKHKPCNNNKSNFGFDIKSLLPLLTSLGGGANNSLNISNMISMLGGGLGGNVNTQGEFDFTKLLSSFLNNKDGLNILGGLFKKKEKPNTQIKSSDIPIKNYTRVE